jgi:hypothetical protein
MARGQKPHTPTEQTRNLVRTLSGIGTPQEDICTLIGISRKQKSTLYKYYRADLDKGMAEANAKISKTLFEMATVDKNVGAAIFWAKARMGWREKHDFEISEEGKKAKAQREAKTAGQGTEWGNDLVSPVRLVINN